MNYAVVGIVAILVAPVSFASDKESAAEEAALAWLTLVDSGRYEASWDAAASLFRQQISRPDWAKAVASARQPFGALKSRELVSATYAESLPGAPDGEYVVLQFSAAYENKSTAVETVTPMWDDDGWRVSGYYIK